MNKAVANFLIEQDRFEEVMTAMRGPDRDEQKYLKQETTAVLRWAVGFQNGDRHPPRTNFIECCDELFLSEPQEMDGHFTRHVFNARIALRLMGWEVSRVPFVAYVDRRAAALEASEILRHAYQYLLGDGREVSEYVEDKDERIINMATDRVCFANAETDPDFELSLDKR
jgi:hypothetical protein